MHGWRVPSNVSRGTRTEFFEFLERDLPRKRTHLEFVLASERRDELGPVKSERDPRCAERDRHLHRLEREPLVADRQRESPAAVLERRREVNTVWMPEDDLPRVTARPGPRLEPASKSIRARAWQVEQSTVSTVCATPVGCKRRTPTQVAEGGSKGHTRNPKVRRGRELPERRRLRAAPNGAFEPVEPRFAERRNLVLWPCVLPEDVSGARVQREASRDPRVERAFAAQRAPQPSLQLIKQSRPEAKTRRLRQSEKGARLDRHLPTDDVPDQLRTPAPQLDFDEHALAIPRKLVGHQARARGMKYGPSQSVSESSRSGSKCSSRRRTRRR